MRGDLSKQQPLWPQGLRQRRRPVRRQANPPRLSRTGPSQGSSRVGSVRKAVRRFSPRVNLYEKYLPEAMLAEAASVFRVMMNLG